MRRDLPVDAGGKEAARVVKYEPHVESDEVSRDIFGLPRLYVHVPDDRCQRVVKAKSHLAEVCYVTY